MGTVGCVTRTGAGLRFKGALLTTTLATRCKRDCWDQRNTLPERDALQSQVSAEITLPEYFGSKDSSIPLAVREEHLFPTLQLAQGGP